MKFNTMDIERLQKGIAGLQKIAMTAQEKAAVRSRLLTYVHAKSVHHNAAVVSPYRFVYFIRQTSFITVMLFLLVLTGAGSVLASKGSLPGDVLYPVKIGIREPIQGIFAVSPVEKIQWESFKAEQRLEEAQILALSGRLDEKKRHEIEDNFERTVRAVELLDTSMATSTSAEQFDGGMDARVEFEATMQAHGALMETLGRDLDDVQKKEMNALGDTVRRNIVGAAQKRNESVNLYFGRVSGEVQSTSTDAKKNSKNVSQKEQEVEKLIQENKKKVQTKATTSFRATSTPSSSVRNELLERAQKTFEQADRSLQEAKENSASGKEKEAYKALLDSRKSAREADISVEHGYSLQQYKEREDKKNTREKDDDRDSRDDRNDD